MAKEDPDLFSPRVIYSYKNDFDITIEVSQELLGGGVETKGG